MDAGETVRAARTTGIGAAAAAIEEQHASTDESTEACRVSERSTATREPALSARSDMWTWSS